MIDTKSLRIGNLVYNFDKNKPFAVISINEMDECGDLADGIMLEDGYKRQYYDPNMVHPIELTEDWLKKFGFKNESRGYVFPNDNHLYLDNGNEEYSLWAEGDYHDLPIAYSIKYIHQLMNLFFALTNTELTLNK